MREILAVLDRWYAAHVPFGLATVVAVSRSAPLGPGAAMAVGPEGQVVGSVSGGCVEGAVFALAEEVVASGEARLETYGYSDEDAFAVGLPCGGEITVLVRPVTPASDPAFGAVAASVAAGDPVTVATVVDGPAPRGATLAVWHGTASGGLGTPGLDAAVAADARGGLALGATGLGRYGPHGERREGEQREGRQREGRQRERERREGQRHERERPETERREDLGNQELGNQDLGDDVTVFLQSFAPPPRMLVFGAIDHAAALARMGEFLGYRVTVCDARPVFAAPHRFPEGVEVVADWPHRYLRGTYTDERTVICVLTHDAKFDVPVLREAVRRPAAYIGVMGSRRTHEERLRRLTESGVTAAELTRLRAPLGLDLGARTPEEVAVSVAGEIIALRWGGSGEPLSMVRGPIHPRR
ncbi:XdhC family protein [Streptomyces sp. NBC_00820]|uniref:XdhC/CoxI family protein n=1 Tax=Streptomyces sp. NBC_00820 TaxID=2975842 RepID=UPI002ED46C17|nr:XdhC family protein [Streptomyces sp. NBC_00820]